MFKSNLFDILKTLSIKEFKEFGEYVESPFFNKNESVIKRINHIQYKIIIKNLTMMIYYELSYFDMAHGVIDSYRHFLSNDKSINELRKVRYLNYINFFNRLLRLKEKNNKKDLENLAFDLKQVNNVIEKDWMMVKN